MDRYNTDANVCQSITVLGLKAGVLERVAVQNDETLNLERRSDGAIVVRVRSRGSVSANLPDAVFAFRAGDPQFAYWDERLRHQEVRS